MMMGFNVVLTIALTYFILLFVQSTDSETGKNPEQDSQTLEEYVEDKIRQRCERLDLLSQQIWQSSNNYLKEFSIRNKTVLKASYCDSKANRINIDARTTNILADDKKLTSSTNHGQLRKRRASGKDYLMFMESVSYGIFGSCYNISLFSKDPFFMIDKCPMFPLDINAIRLCNTSRSIKEFDRCSIDMELIPVSDERGYVYKNIYCARCHGAKNITTWEVELSYISISPIRFYEQDLSLTFLENLNPNPKCVPSVYPLKPKGLMLCDDLKYHSNVNDHPNHHLRYVQYPIKEKQQKEYPLSFTILMNFGINGKGHVFFSTAGMTQVIAHPCEENEIYDPDMHACRRVVCKSGYIWVDKKCIPTDQNFDSLSKNDLTEVGNSEYPLQITYRINVTLQGILVLQTPTACNFITESFAEMLNISTSRILNLKIQLLNETSTKKSMEIHQIETKPIEQNSAILGMNNTDTHCETYVTLEDDRVELLENNGSITQTVEFSFLLSPTKNPSGIHSTNEYIKKKLLLEGSFTFAINGTEFHTDNSYANTEVELDLWCTKGIKDQKFDNQFDVITRVVNGEKVNGVYVNSTGKFYPPGMFNLWVWVMGKIGNFTDVSTDVYVFLCNMPKIKNKDCARFEIKTSDYARLQNNSIILENGRVLNMSEYEYVREDSLDIQICVPKSYLRPELLTEATKFGCGDSYKNVLLAEGYISFALGIISTIVLAAVLVTYGIFEKLRNLPGLNTMSLTLSLFLGELLFLISGSIQYDDERSCQAVGASLHFIFLASFFWMNVMSYDVFRTFANKCILTRIRKKHIYFPRYSLYAWGTPAMIVLICCILDFTDYFPNAKIGYGGTTDGSVGNFQFTGNDTASQGPQTQISKQKLGCWIQNPVAALIAFGSPMIGILFANSVMFIRTIICIRSVTKFVSLRTRRSSVSNAIGKHDVMLYVRMSTVMGFTWVFGLASSIVSSFSDGPSDTVCVALHVLGLLYIIFNCSQGLFIFVVFVCNKRVGSLYKDLFRRIVQNVSAISRHASIKSSTESMFVASVSENTHF